MLLGAPTVADCTTKALAVTSYVTAGVLVVSADDATVWLAETVYVPLPPLPVPSAVICVPAVTPVPRTSWPTESAPEETAVTVSVVPAIEPVSAAPAGPTTPSAVVMSSAAAENEVAELSTMLPLVCGDPSMVTVSTPVSACSCASVIEPRLPPRSHAPTGAALYCENSTFAGFTLE